MIKEKETKTENSKCCQDVFKHGKHHHSHCNCGQIPLFMA